MRRGRAARYSWETTTTKRSRTTHHWLHFCQFRFNFGAFSFRYTTISLRITILRYPSVTANFLPSSLSVFCMLCKHTEAKGRERERARANEPIRSFVNCTLIMPFEFMLGKICTCNRLNSLFRYSQHPIIITIMPFYLWNTKTILWSGKNERTNECRREKRKKNPKK